MSTKNNILSLTAVAATLLSGAALAEVQANLTLKNADSLVASDDVVAQISFTNTDSRPVRMLSYLMKANKDGDLEEDLFKVTRDGKEVPYEGRHVKRLAPKPSDYITIRPGQTVSYSVELSGVYDLKQAGNYEFQYKTMNMNLFAAQPMLDHKAAIMGMDGVVSNQTSAYVTGDVSYVKADNDSSVRCNPSKQDCSGGTETPLAGSVTFSGACSSGEQSNLITALAAAKTMANNAVSSLNGSAGARYTTWFGTYNSSRFNTVANHFDAIKNALDNKPLTLDCSCNQNYYAYVYPNKPYKIYFCNAFWSAPVTGTDSRGGTIIHETSHFDAVAGTDDIVYGQSGAKSLAISNPSNAIKNADSHEYFAENTPSQN